MDFFGIPSGLLSPLAILCSAVLALLSARFTVNSQRVIARTRATSDIITKIETDKDIIKAETNFAVLKKAKFKTLIDGTCSDDERIHIITFLNMYENIFLGISMDVYDELLFFRYKRGVLFSHWDAVKDLVMHWRKEEQNDRIYEMFELFVSKWKDNSFVCRKGKYPEYYLHTTDISRIQNQVL